MQRRQGCELVGGLALQQAGKQRHCHGCDVVIARQHPGRRHRIKPEHHQADDVARDQRVAVQAEGWHAAPDQQQPDDCGDRALHDDVVPGGHLGGSRVGGQPVIHLVGEPAPELAADGIDHDGVRETGRRGAGPELIHGIQALQHQPHRNDLQVPQRRMPGHHRPRSRHRMPAGRWPVPCAAAARRRRGGPSGADAQPTHQAARCQWRSCLASVRHTRSHVRHLLHTSPARKPIRRLPSTCSLRRFSTRELDRHGASSGSCCSATPLSSIRAR